ncbi:MAG: enoyl-CoA hydratase/isomerase family protein [Alphaproteobacteria bacterium]|nr:enoyl-CoA hydratase/isomerase family protein [Alphaproteobacteria bacterium]
MVEEIELSVQGEIAFVRLRRPSEGNALRGTMFDALRKLGLKLADSPPKYVVLSGEGDDFCVGLSRSSDEPLMQLFDPLIRSRDTHGAAELVRRLRSSLETFSRLPCPVIAAIEGRCHGAGLEFALMADLRVAAQDATFAMHEGHHNILTGLGGLGRLVASLGPGRAAHLALTGHQMSAAEAEILGLVQTVAPHGGALNAAVDLVHELRRTGPTARLQTVLALRAIQGRLATDLQDIETQHAARTWMSAEYQVADDGTT